jgi:hypothetical protein
MLDMADESVSSRLQAEGSLLRAADRAGVPTLRALLRPLGLDDLGPTVTCTAPFRAGQHASAAADRFERHGSRAVVVPLPALLGRACLLRNRPSDSCDCVTP